MELVRKLNKQKTIVLARNAMCSSLKNDVCLCKERERRMESEGVQRGQEQDEEREDVQIVHHLEEAGGEKYLIQ